MISNQTTTFRRPMRRWLTGLLAVGLLLATAHLLRADTWQKVTDPDGKVRYVRVPDGGSASGVSGTNDNTGNTANTGNTSGRNDSGRSGVRPASPPPPPRSGGSGPSTPGEGIAASPMIGPGQVIGPFVIEEVAEAPTTQPDEAAEAPTTQPDQEAEAPTTQPDTEVAVGPAPHAPAAPAQPQAPVVPKTIRFVFANQQLSNILQYFSRITGLSIIGTTNVTGEVTYYSPRAYTIDEAIDVLNSILMTRSLYMIRDRNHLLLMPLAEVKTRPLPVYKGTLPGPDVLPNQIVTVVLSTPGVARDMAVQLRPLVSTFGAMSPSGGDLLVVTDTAANIRSLASVINAVQTPGLSPTEVEFRVFKLKFADPDQMVQTLIQLTGTPITVKEGDKTVVHRRTPGAIVPDRRSGSILVMASHDDMKQVEDIINKLDTELGGEQATLVTKMFQLQHADVRRASDVISNAFRGQKYTGDGKPVAAGSDIRVTVDEQFRRLIVTATPARMKDIEELIANLEKVQESIEQHKIVTLKYAQASQLANTLRRLIPRQGELKLEVVEDNRLNTLLLQTNAGAMMDRADELIRELDVPVPGASTQPDEELVRDIRIVDLRQLDARKFIEHVNNMLVNTGKLGDPKPIMDASDDSRSLLLSSTEKQWQQIKALMEDLEKSATDQKTKTEIFRLTNIKPSELERAVQQFFGGASRYNRAASGGVTTVSDDKRMILVVDAQPTQMEQVRELTRQLDVPQPGIVNENSELRTYKAQTAQQARQAVTLVQKLLSDKLASGELAVSFDVDDPTATIFVTAKPSDFKLVEAKLNEAQSELRSKGAMRSFKLQYALPSQLAGPIDALVRARPHTGPADDRLRLQPDDRGGNLFAWSDTQTLDLVGQLVKQLDVPDLEDQTLPFHAVVLESADPAKVADTLNNLLQDVNRQLRHQRKPQVRLQADADSGRLFIFADDESFARVKQLAEEIDKASQGQRAEVRTVAIKGDPARMIETVSRLYGQYNGRRQGFVLPKNTQMVAAPAGRGIILTGDPHVVEDMVQAIGKLDAESADDVTEVRNYQMSSGQAAASARDDLVRAFAPDVKSGAMAASFDADPASALLFVTARKADFARIEKMLETLKQQFKGRTVLRQLPVNNLDSHLVAGPLGQILTGQQYNAQVAPSPNGRFVIVTGEAGAVDFAQEVLKELDRPGMAGTSPDIRGVELKVANASTVAATMTDLYADLNKIRASEGKLQIRFRGDDTTGRLYVIADKDAYNEVVPLIQDLDKAGVPSAETRLIKLNTTAKADDVAAILSNLCSGRRDLGDVRISPDRNQNAVVVSASASAMPQISQIIASLDGGQAAPDATTRSYELADGANAQQLASALGVAFAEKIRREEMIAAFVPEPMSNTLFVTARANDFALIEKEIERLRTRVLARSVVKIVPVATGNSWNLVSVLQTVLASQNQGRPATEQLRISADQQGTQLVLAGAPDLVQTAEQLVTNLAAGGPDAVPQIRIVRLTSAKADEMANTLRTALGIGQQNGPKVAGSNARIATDVASNSLIVTGPGTDVAAIEQLVGKLQEGAGANSSIHRVVLANVWPADMIKVINDLYGRQGSPVSGPMTIAEDPSGDALVINTTDANWKVLDGLIRQLDVAPVARAQIHYIPLFTAKADELIDKLRPLAEDRWGKGHAPTMDSDLITNQIIFSGTDEQYVWVDKLVTEMDGLGTTEGGRRVVTEIIPLPRGMNARKAAQSLQIIYPQLDESNGGVKVIEFKAPDEGGIIIRDMSQPTGPATPPVRPTAAPGQPHSQLTPGSFGRFGPMVRAILAAAIGADGEGDGNGNGNGEPPTIEVPDDSGPTGKPKGHVMTAGRPTTQPADESIPPTVFYDPVTNALVVQGTADQVQRIHDILDALAESGQGTDYEIRIYKLTNAEPESLAATLEKLFNDVRTAQTAQTVQQQVQQIQQQQQGGDQQNQSGRGRRGQQGGQTNGQTQPGQAQQPQQQAARQVVRRITVVPDLRTNSIIVKASSSEFTLIEPLVRALDVVLPPGVLEVRVFTLKNIDASEAERNLKQLFRMTGGGGGQESGTTLAALKQQIVRMQKAGTAPTDQEMIQLINAGRMTITANTAANSLVVAAPTEGLAVIEQLLTILDKAPVAVETKVKIFPLSNARAEELAPIFTATYTQQRQARGGTARQQTTPAVVSPDPRSNSLIVKAAASDMEEIGQLILELDKKGSEGVLVVYRLKYGDARQLAQALSQIYGGSGGGRGGRGGATGTSVKIAADTASNSLLVTAPEIDQKAIAAMVEKLDAGNEWVPKMQVYPLKVAQATDVAAAINQVVRAQPRVQGRPVASAQGDATTNTVIVMGVPEDQTMIEGLIKQLESGEGAARKVQTLQLKFAKSDDIVNALKPLYQQSGGGRGRGAGATPAVITSEPASNTILINGTDAQIKEVTTLVAQMDREDISGKMETKVVTLNRADAVDLAPMLQKVHDAAVNSTTPKGAKAARVAIGADSGTNSIVLAGPADQFPAIEQLIEKLDTIPPGGGDLKVYVVPLKNTSPDDMKKLLDEMIKGQSGAKGAKGSTGPRAMPGVRVDVSSVPNASALIVSADEKTMAELQKLIDQIEAASGPQKLQVKIFPLKNAQAAALAQSLTRLFQQQLASRRGQPLRPEDQISVSGDATTNSLVVAASAERMAEVEGLVQQLDAIQVNPSGFKIIALQHAEAAKVATMLTNMLRQGGQPGIKFSIAPDERTNVLIVTAPENMLPQIQELVDKLDQVPPFSEAVMTVLALKHSDATKLATVISGMLKRDDKGVVTPAAKAIQEQIRRMKVVTGDGKPVTDLDLDKPINITPEAGTNSLVISSSEENVAAITAVIKMMDALPLADAVTVRIFPVKNADATQLSQSLSKLFDDSRKLLLQPGTGKPAAPGQVTTESAVGKALANQVSFAVDTRTNTLLAAGVEEAVALVEVLVNQLDVPSLSGSIETQIVPVAHGDAGLLAPLLTTLFTNRLNASLAPGARALPSDQVTIGVEPLTNSLIVTAKKSNMEILQGLLSKLDIEPPSDSGLVRFYVLKFADANRVADMVSGLYKNGIYVPGQAASRTATPADKVTITSDLRTNSVVVSASKQNLAIIEGLINTLDKPTPEGAFGDIRLFPVVNADATKTAPLLQQLFDRKQAAAKQAGVDLLPVTVTSDIRSNTLIVSGSKEAFTDVERLLKDLDKVDPTRTMDIRLFELKSASAITLAPMLDSLMTKRRSAGGAGTTQSAAVTIAADDASNTLIVSATRDDMSIVEDLVAKLDRTPDASDGTQIFPLLQADADAMAQTLKQLYAQRTQSKSVNISVDSRLNAIVVQAAKADMQAVGDLIKKLDNAPVTVFKTMRIFPLQNAEADTLAKILADMLSDKGSSSAANSARRATLTKFVSNNQAISQAILTYKDEILVAPDARTNSLLLSAPAETVDMLESLIKELDTPSRVWAQVEIFQLKNADASQTAQIVKDLFQLGASSNKNTQQPQQQFQLGPTPPAGMPTPVTPVATPATPAAVGPAIAGVTPSGTPPSPYRPELSLVVDSRTNSLIVTGVPEDLQVVKELIDKLDGSDVVERVNKVYTIKNGKASEIATALNAHLTKLSQNMTALLGSNASKSGLAALDTQVSVVAEDSSNKLLLSASPRYFEEVSQIVNELDQPPPQVLIQVLLAEVTLTDDTQVGAELKYTTAVKAGTFSAGTSFGVQAAQALNGGIAVSLTGTDFEFFLRALRAQSRVEVLSRPQILASDNQEAEINVGSRVPIVTSTQITSNGDNYSNVTYEDVGIILKVTPKINADGFVNMLISPEISSLSKSTVQINNGTELPIINNRSATTTVTVKDNQTIVIGGLIRTSESDTQRKVPVLGDLPGIWGAAWRSTSRTKERTELLIVLTPRVLRTVEDAARVSTEERNRITIMPRNSEDTELMNIRPPQGPPFTQSVDTEIRTPGARNQPLPSPQAPTPPDKPAPGEPGSMTAPPSPTTQPDGRVGSVAPSDPRVGLSAAAQGLAAILAPPAKAGPVELGDASVHAAPTPPEELPPVRIDPDLLTADRRE
ncbi:MAG: hypothetical protein BIFFINMI_01123 [Phycisphaerae bacterium]|nr:hypothetical protein [Phycisphaerae bacterium]